MDKIFKKIARNKFFLIFLMASLFVLIGCAPDSDSDSTDANVDAGKMKITFNIKDNHSDFVEVSQYGPLTPTDIRFTAAQLDATNNWKQVIYERMSEGTFTANEDGTYTYVSNADVNYSDADYPVRDAPYDASKTYRVGIAFGGHGGPPSSPTYDFRPSDGATDSAVIDSRNIVQTATCEKCHGKEFHGHGGDRKEIENCVTCHNPTTLVDDLENNLKDGEMDSSSMDIMAHNIHNGTDDYWIYRTRAGGNWYNWGDETTEERATREMLFPDKAYNCTVCHESDTETMSEGLNWQTKPSIVSCGDSCHTDVDFVTGTGHEPGAADNANCALCHDANNIMTKHSTANTDIMSAADLALNTPEFTVEVSLVDSDGATIDPTTDVSGTAPMVKIVIKENGTAIDHTEVTSWPDGSHAYLFVYGPRSRMKPVLTTAAAAGGLGYYANNNLKTDAKATIAADSITYQLDTADGLTAGTYIAYVDVNKVKGDATSGYQAPSYGKTNFQVGTATVEEQVAGNCAACHGDTLMHASTTSRHRHDTKFDAENCGACHDYTQGNSTAGPFDWFGAVPNSKRVHAVHAGALLIDPDYTIEHAPAEEGDLWSQIVFPSVLNDCEQCHNPANSSTKWKENPNQLACMGCHDTDSASTHFVAMGGDSATDVGDGLDTTCVACHGGSGAVDVSTVHNIKEYDHPTPDVSYAGEITEAAVVE